MVLLQYISTAIICTVFNSTQYLSQKTSTKELPNQYATALRPGEQGRSVVLSCKTDEKNVEWYQHDGDKVVVLPYELRATIETLSNGSILSHLWFPTNINSSLLNKSYVLTTKAGLLHMANVTLYPEQAIKKANMHWADYVVFAFMLLVSLGIGLYFGFCGSGNATATEYLLADRQMGIVPVTLSLVASFMSAITLLGTPAEIYMFGTQYMAIGLAFICVLPVVAFVFLPILYHLKPTSAYEYLEYRYNKLARVVGACFFITQMTLYMSMVMLAPSLAISAVSNFGVWEAVFSIGIIGTAYTAIGGMKAVMWTDAFQICIMYIGVVTILIKGGIDIGGFPLAWERLDASGRAVFNDFSMDPFVKHTFWTTTFGSFWAWLAIYACNQAQVQRYLSSRTLRTAQISVLLNIPGLLLFMILPAFCGVLIYARFYDCEIIRYGAIQSMDQALPYYALEVLSDLPGFGGLFLSCLFSGALSTISSGLNGLAAVTLKDIIGTWKPDISETQSAKLSKILSFAYGGLAILVVLIAKNMKGLLSAALGLFGVVGGPVFGLFFLGMCFPWVNWIGALASMAIAFVITLWTFLGQYVYKGIPGFQLMDTPEYSTTGCPVHLNGTIYAVYPAVPLDNSVKDPLGVWYSLSYLYYCPLTLSIMLMLAVPISNLAVRMGWCSQTASMVDTRLYHVKWRGFVEKVFCCVAGDAEESIEKSDKKAERLHLHEKKESYNGSR